MKKKQFTLQELREKARIFTKEALRSFEPIPENQRKDLVLGTGFDGDDRIFELYFPGERPEDAVIITRVKLNADTGKMTGKGYVEVFLPRKGKTGPIGISATDIDDYLTDCDLGDIPD
ncbi:MAG: hypothetical protein JEZ02_18825 [Desulfatibacillum sp.]|nr:hypothetical protein [Desulfatibacillum sp.]